MSYQLLLTLFVQATITNGAPLLLTPIPWTGQSTQQLVLQQQLIELQALQQLAAQTSIQISHQPQPIMILLPTQDLQPNNNPNEHLKLHKENEHKDAIHSNLENEDDLNSVIIDAASETAENENQAILQPHRAILLIPNGRLSIGEIVSAIPWLPIEINVPDTISWAYNGIASGIGSIISIIGRPFQGNPQVMQGQEAGLKALLRHIQTTKQNMVRPIIMMPIDGSVLPIQV